MIVTLSSPSIQKAAKQLRDYAKALPAKMDAACRQLAEIGANAAIGTLSTSEMDTAAAIRVEKGGEVGYLVVSDGEEAAFVEFGTGVMGEGTYPGDLPPEWGYDLRWTPEAHDPKQPERWFYYDEENRRRWTWGRTARGYMFVGSEIMRDMVMPIFEDVFR